MKRYKYAFCLVLACCVLLQTLCQMPTFHMNPVNTSGKGNLAVMTAYTAQTPITNNEAYCSEQEQTSGLLGFVNGTRNKKLQIIEVILPINLSHSFCEKGSLLIAHMFRGFLSEHLSNHVIINFVHHKDGSKGVTLL